MLTANDTLKRVAALFDQLADLPSDEQNAILERIREEEPAVEAAVRRLIEVESLLPEPPQASEAQSFREADRGSSVIFGQYRALRMIGQGGMGSVYLAERSDGQFSRQAAIKVIQGSLATDEMRIRFLSERQILATLQHPGIATLLDGGVTDSGEPFLVMEYVEGLPLNTFCDLNKLTVSQRIDLFLEVCAAVDFAHRHLIIHRDLKPSNILVNGDGKPKLLDFGAAKLLGPVPIDKTKQFLTPRYASPEQMRGDSAAVSMDVYALGIILYELLTGNWPFGDPTDMASNLRRASSEVQPSPPTASREAAEARSTSESTLKKELRGDLSAILNKALEADVSLRYGTVGEFAADVKRYRTGQPVLARPQTTWYKVRKWIVRNPVQTAAAGLAIAGVLTGVVLREQQRSVAEHRFDELRSLARYQIFDLQDQMYFYGTPLQVRKLMAERSLQTLNELSSESAPAFDLQADLTEGFTQMAELLGNPLRANLGNPEQGRRVLARARQMNDVLQAMQGPARVKQAAQARLEMQEAMYDVGALRTAERLVRARQAMRAWEALSDLETMTPEEISRMATLYLVLAVNQAQISGAVDPFDKGLGDLPKARRLIDIAVRKAPQHPLIRYASLQIGVNEAQQLSNTDHEAGRKALASLVEELEAFEAGESTSERVRFLRARTLGVLGWTEGQMKQFETALNHMQRSSDAWRQLMESNPSQVNYRYELAGSLRDTAFIHGYAKNHADAALSMEESLKQYERLLDRGPNRLYSTQAAELRVRLGVELAAAGRTDEARAAIKRGQSELLALAGTTDPGARPVYLAARYLIDVPLPECRRPAEALQLALRADGMQPNDPMTLEILTKAYAFGGTREQALAALARFKAAVPKGNDTGKQQIRELSSEVETILADLGK